MRAGDAITGTWDGIDWAAGLSEASRSIVEEVRRETEGIYRHAEEHWPVKRLRSRDSRGKLMMRVLIDVDGVKGQVRNGASYARYIQSSQIATMAPEPMTEREMRDLHARASTPAQHAAVSEVIDTDAAFRRQSEANAAAVQATLTTYYGIHRSGSKAARSGSAVWLLLRWPEKGAAARLTESLGPIIEADLQEAIDGR